MADELRRPSGFESEIWWAVIHQCLNKPILLEDTTGRQFFVVAIQNSGAKIDLGKEANKDASNGI